MAVDMSIYDGLEFPDFDMPAPEPPPAPRLTCVDHSKHTWMHADAATCPLRESAPGIPPMAGGSAVPGRVVDRCATAMQLVDPADSHNYDWAGYCAHLDAARQHAPEPPAWEEGVQGRDVPHACHGCGEGLRYCTPEQQEAGVFCRNLCIGHCDQCHRAPTYKLFPRGY